MFYVDSISFYFFWHNNKLSKNSYNSKSKSVIYHLLHDLNGMFQFFELFKIQKTGQFQATHYLRGKNRPMFNINLKSCPLKWSHFWSIHLTRWIFTSNLFSMDYKPLCTTNLTLIASSWVRLRDLFQPMKFPL
jgi:hypothetical protein